MKISVLFVTLATLFSICCQTVSGDLLIEILQIGNDVVVTSSGTVDTTNLEGGSTFDDFNGFLQPALPPSSYLMAAQLLIGLPRDEGRRSVDFYFNANFEPVVGPSSYGFGLNAFVPDIGSGDLHGFTTNSPPDTEGFPVIFVPEGYVSGDFLSSQMTFLDSSLNDIGVTEGTLTWSFADNEITLFIGVPVGLPPTLGDVDRDGEVTFSDIAPFIEVLASGGFLAEADCNQDGEVTFADIPAFIEILIAS